MDYTEHRVAVDGAEMRYVEAGAGPTMVWLPGAGGVQPTAGTDLLTEHFHLLCLELPGFGTASERDTAESFDELGEAVAGCMDALGYASYLLHGTSFGGATALHVALNHPDRVQRLILESPSAFRPLGWTPPDVETVRRGLFRYPERARPVQVDPQEALRQRQFVNRLSLTIDREALGARLRGLHVPMVVIFGDSDLITPPALAQMYCDQAPACESILIEDAGHVISSDQPEAYAQAVTRFALSTSAAV